MQHGYRQSNTGRELQTCCIFAGISARQYKYNEDKEFEEKLDEVVP